MIRRLLARRREWNAPVPYVPATPCCTPATRAMGRLADEPTSTADILDDYLTEVDPGTAPTHLGLDDYGLGEVEAELGPARDRRWAS